MVDELAIEFGPGLNVLSGETGAGKSLLVDALDLLVGGRPSTELIRAGSSRAVVEGRFEIGVEGLEGRLADAGIDTSEGWLILRRELRREGRNRAWVNASPATTALLRDIGSRLVDLHGQHEHQRLLHGSEQRRILDAFGGHRALAEEVAAAHRQLTEALGELEAVRRISHEGVERADDLRFKLEEIEGAGLDPLEEDALRAEERRLAHSEDLIELAGGLHETIYESEGSLVERLGELGRPLGELVSIDDAAGRFRDLHETALRALEEMGRELGIYRDAIEHDPGRLAAIRDRLDALYRLKRKYGASVEAVIEAGRAARAELEGIETAEAEVERLEAECAERQARLHGLSSRLSDARAAAAEQLEAAVVESFPALGLEGGRFRVSFEPLGDVGPAGAERVGFLVSLNPGFPPAPLSRVASGGEMSRIMLALKTALVSVDEVPVLVFDEIDQGIGGEVAHRVAERLLRVAASHQVLVVTHLAQIASRADAHFSVGKETTEGQVRTRVRRLEMPGRIEELARMLGGDPGSATSRAHAQELLAGRI